MTQIMLALLSALTATNTVPPGASVLMINGVPLTINGIPLTITGS